MLDGTNSGSQALVCPHNSQFFLWFSLSLSLFPILQLQKTVRPSYGQIRQENARPPIHTTMQHSEPFKNSKIENISNFKQMQNKNYLPLLNNRGQYEITEWKRDILYTVYVPYLK